VWKLIITGLGTGHLPVAPGTWGSAAATLVFLLAAWAGGGKALPATAAMLAVAALASAACLAWGRRAQKVFASKDPRQCTADEWAGQAIALCFLPLGTNLWGHLTAAGVGFLAFRLLDILKPPPARQAEKLPGGWGILGDDLMAGLYANALGQIILRLVLFR